MDEPRAYSLLRTFLSLVAGLLVFLVLVPVAMVAGLGVLHPVQVPSQVPLLRLGTCLGLMLAGLVLDYLALSAFVLRGRGTQMPFTPTVRLVTEGPFRYVRNPILLGVSITYFGLASLLFGWAIGALVLVSTWLVMSPYYYYIEEPQLEVRFGEAYREYRRRTPFLLPGLRRRKAPPRRPEH